MNLIVAVDENWGIGYKGNLLFSIKQDMKFFRETTQNHIVVMGRKTLDSFPGGKPLKNRVNIVLTKNTDFKRDGVIVCHSTDEVLEELKKYSDDVFVIGGEQIYKEFLPYCDTAYVTKVRAKRMADAHMVNLDLSDEWETLQNTKDFADNELTYQFYIYKRVK
ncbi:MAG: dihydrofolate reductase [Clostridia bacterium]|nr:dihydrofolate reductase [Clostridia bacterium]